MLGASTCGNPIMIGKNWAKNIAPFSSYSKRLLFWWTYHPYRAYGGSYDSCSWRQMFLFCTPTIEYCIHNVVVAIWRYRITEIFVSSFVSHSTAIIPRLLRNASAVWQLWCWSHRYLFMHFCRGTLLTVLQYGRLWVCASKAFPLHSWCH